VDGAAVMEGHLPALENSGLFFYGGTTGLKLFFEPV
jgi:hypothetical protein